ncbi:hypothetical protein H2200_005855 [Cladophialophora chaetospira]|uniref:Uncharacterized protein n=1 Tax=Cladophialophora chaetospira TaxID=386627 RepID=A0AA38XAG1_9EURO|nr:hypothetical protein H2200_005855 [Cladophialophora chaetospira]
MDVPMMPRLRATLIAQGFRPEEFDMDKTMKAIEASVLAIATKMPKVVETLDSIQEDFRRMVFASFQSPQSEPYFKNKYYTYIEDMMIDNNLKNPPQLTPFKLYLWTLKYESKQKLGTLEGNDAHGPLPLGWKAWITIALASVIVLQQFQVKGQKDKLLRHVEEMFTVYDAPYVISKVPGTAMQIAWQATYERVRDFNRRLGFMAVKYHTVMGVEPRNNRNGNPPKTIYEILREQINTMYPNIELTNFAIEENLGPAPLDGTYNGSELRGDLRWLLQRTLQTGYGPTSE